MQNEIMNNSLEDLINYINMNEKFLMEQILSYATKYDYTKYTSTLVEPWRLSISGLSESLTKLIKKTGDDIELHPDEDYKSDAATRFGIIEAEKHRKRGISLEMFLGLMKYYNQSYRDLIKISSFDDEIKEYYNNIVNRFFDRVEIAFCKTWATQEHSDLISELQSKNRQMTNEKNKFLTIFESLSVAVIIIDQNGIIENINLAADNFQNNKSVSGYNYYSDIDKKLKFIELFPQFSESYIRFIDCNKEKDTDEIYIEGTEQYFNMTCSKSLDISGKLSGSIVILSEITKYKELENKLSLLAETDPLTGINNRRSFLGYFENEIERKKRYNKKLALVMIDIDHFKNINDKFGHDSGDIVIKTLVEEIRSRVRNTDILCRWGGEEFLVLLPEFERKQAAEFIERLRIHISKIVVMTPDDQTISFTVSFGLTIINENENDIDAMIKRVDTALYSAKSQGRNTLVIV